MESRQLTLSRLDKTNAHPPQGPAHVFPKKHAPPPPAMAETAHRSSGISQNGENVRCVRPSSVQFSCLAPRSLRSPSAAYLLRSLRSQWLTFVTRSSSFRCILAPTVPFAWGFYPVVSKLPPDLRLYSGQPHDIIGPYSVVMAEFRRPRQYTAPAGACQPLRRDFARGFRVLRRRGGA